MNRGLAFSGGVVAGIGGVVDPCGCVRAYDECGGSRILEIFVNISGMGGPPDAEWLHDLPKWVILR